MIADKFKFNDLLIRVMPGGFFVTLVLFTSNYQLALNDKLDFLYSFIFFCVSFIVGEVLQTISHEFEFLVDIFFKGYRPSEIFLTEGNPVISNESIRKKLLKSLKISTKEKNLVGKKYKNVSLFSKKDNQFSAISQSIFWKLFTKHENNEAVMRTNVNYLFTRVITTVFLITTFYFLFINLGLLAIASLIVTVLFLWRARGLARGLVLKVVLIHLKG